MDEKLITSTSRQVYVKFELLRDNNIVDTLQGVAFQGSITGNAQSDIRRTGTIGLILNDYKDFIPNEKSKIWLNSEVIVYIGLKDKFDIIRWEKQGNFIFLNFTISKNNKGTTMDCSIGDKMVLLNGTISGTLDVETVLMPEGITIAQAMGNTLNELGKINKNNILISEMDEPLPYEISVAPGETVAGLFKKLLNLYMGREMFFDGNFFIARPIQFGEGDTYAWDFTKDNHNLNITENNGIDFSNVKNKTTIYGKIGDNGVQLHTRYCNKYLRHHLNRLIFPTYDEIEIPFIHDQIPGDICHINDVQRVREIYGDCDWTFDSTEAEESMFSSQPPDRIRESILQWRQDRYKRHFLGQPRSYLWTNKYTRDQYFTTDPTDKDHFTGINTGPEGLIRLDTYPDLSYPVIATSLLDPTIALELEPDFTKKCEGEESTRWFHVNKISPEPIAKELAEPVPGQNYTRYKTAREIYDVVHAKVYINGQLAKGVKVTNRDRQGCLIMNKPLTKYDKVYVEYLARNSGKRYINQNIKVNYTYTLQKYQWIELDFNVVPQFRVEEIGENPFAYTSQEILNMKQANLRAELELFNHSHLAEKINCTCVPIYNLKENRKIKIEDESIGVGTDYLIDNITIPLDINSPMSFSAHKIIVPFKVLPISRPLPPALLLPCKRTEIIYPKTASQYYSFNKNTLGLEVLERVAGKRSYALSTSQREQIIDFAKKVRLLPTDSEINEFNRDVRFLVFNVLFYDKSDRDDFMNAALYSPRQLLQITQSMPKLNVSRPPLEMVRQRCHYLGGIDGRVTVDYDLGTGNTMEKLEVFLPEDPPDSFKNLEALPEKEEDVCEYVFNNFPKIKPYMPPRGLQENPVAYTYSPTTFNFVRRSGTLQFPWKYWDNETSASVKVTSHFCAYTVFNYDFWVTKGLVNEEYKSDKYDQEVTDEVWLGAIPSSNYTIDAYLSHGNTYDKMVVKYKDKILAQTQFIQKPSQESLVFNWNPDEGDYKVNVTVYSRLKSRSYEP